jgi:subtilisin family serine protease
MTVFHYYSNGKLHALNVQSPERLAATRQKESGKGGASARRSMNVMVADVQAAIHVQSARLALLFNTVAESSVRIATSKGDGSAVIPTETIVIDGATKTEIKWLQNKFGLEVVREGRRAKVLLRSPEGGEAGIRQVFDAAKASFERGHVGAAHPNFVRIMQHIKPSAPGGKPLWNQTNDGSPGLPGADVAALAAWTISQGLPDIRIAVLDEGVDTNHPALKPAVVAEADFVDANPNAQPDGDDAHGTACAGIIVSRDVKIPGLAPNCSLVAVRIAKGDGNVGWVFDDFQTADAIDWAWEEGKADVLSNSWGGGPPVDVITRAFERARTRGRGGKGAVVVIAAGNSNGPVTYPGTLPEVITVGASNWWDERKSPQSKDGEKWWGSCYGASLDLLAPGVRIATCDILGSHGYSDNDFVLTFNGTSSATPHVAAAAGLLLSVAPGLKQNKVREVINVTADRLDPGGKWNKYVGWGRLNVFNALRLARRV